MTQNQRPITPMQKEQKDAEHNDGKNQDTAQSETDPSSELGLTSPVQEAESSQLGKASPQDRSPAAREDTPKPLGKESRNDQ